MCTRAIRPHRRVHRRLQSSVSLGYRDSWLVPIYIFLGGARHCEIRVWPTKITTYHMTGSASGQDEANPLATRAPILPAQYCPLCSRKSEIVWCNPLAMIIINPLLTKLIRSRWLDIGIVLFFCSYGPRLCLDP